MILQIQSFTGLRSQGGSVTPQQFNKLIQSLEVQRNRIQSSFKELENRIKNLEKSIDQLKDSK